jgi:hypothetical protein
MSDDFNRKSKKSIKGRKRREEVEDDDDEIDQEIDEEIEYHEEDSDEDESDSGSDSDMKEQIDEHDEISSSIEESRVNIDALALDSQTKNRLKSGYVSDILYFEMQSTLGSLQPVNELRSDQPFIAGSKDKSKSASIFQRSGHEISEIQAIRLVSVQSTFQVSISANVNGLKDSKSTTCRKNGVKAHIIANPCSTEIPPTPRLLMCPTVKKVDPFLEKYPNLSVERALMGAVDAQGMCLLEKNSPLLEFMNKETNAKVSSVNTKISAVSSSDKDAAIAKITERLENKNICDIRDITLTVERAWPRSDSGIVSFDDVSEIENQLPVGLISSKVDEYKRDAKNRIGKFSVALEVIHRPLSTQ